MLSILTIPLSQAECEKQFSILRKCWSSERNSLSHEALTSLLTLKGSGGQQPCHKGAIQQGKTSAAKIKRQIWFFCCNQLFIPLILSLLRPHILPIPLTFPFIPLPLPFPPIPTPLIPQSPLVFCHHPLPYLSHEQWICTCRVIKNLLMVRFIPHAPSLLRPMPVFYNYSKWISNSLTRYCRAIFYLKFFICLYECMLSHYGRWHNQWWMLYNLYRKK